jgi:hypothetical protein
MKMKILLVTLAAVILVAGTAVAVKTYVQRNATFAPGYQPASYPGNQGYGYGPGGCNGGCGLQAGPGNVQGTDLAAVKRLAADYYTSTYNDSVFDVQVKDFGCHQEAYIIKDGEPVKRLSISGGNVYEVG